MSEEVYICRDCETWHISYESLKHYDSTSGGFCRTCGSPDLLLESEMDESQREFYVGRNTCLTVYAD